MFWDFTGIVILKQNTILTKPTDSDTQNLSEIGLQWGVETENYLFVELDRFGDKRVDIFP